MSSRIRFFGGRRTILSMPSTCCAVGCTNRKDKHSDKGFYRIPADPARRQIWVKVINRGEGWEPSEYTRLCSDHFVTGKPSKLPGHPDYVPSIFCEKRQKKGTGSRASVGSAYKERKRERDFESVDAANVLVELCKYPRLSNHGSQLLVEHSDQCNKEVEQEIAASAVKNDAGATTTICGDKHPLVKTEAKESLSESTTDVALLQANVVALQYENKQLKRQVELLIARNNQLWDEKKANHDFSKDFLALKLANEELKKELESAKMEIKTARFSSFCLNSSFKTFNY